MLQIEELNSGPPKTNPSSGREQDLNSEPPDYKSSALATRPHNVNSCKLKNFRLKFYSCVGCVYNCDDQSCLHIFLCNSNI